MRIEPSEILDFWLNELEPKDWYVQNDAVDETIRTRFMEHWQDAVDGKAKGWTCSAKGTLALLILLDQFSRNMFRNDPSAFASDVKALKVAKQAISKGYDMATDLPARQFFYLPLEHSESVTDQDHCVRLIAMNMESGELLRHAKAHREVIRKYGRFPYRNDPLGRVSTEAENAYLVAGGYKHTLENLAA